MYTSLNEALTEWKANTSDRQKLQHTYMIAAIGLFVVAGVFGLFNYGLGQNILMGATIAAGLFVANAVWWALLQSFVLLRIGQQKSAGTKSKS